MKKIITMFIVLCLFGCSNSSLSEEKDKAEIRKLLREQQEYVVKVREIDSKIKSKIDLIKQYSQVDNLFKPVAPKIPKVPTPAVVQNTTGTK